MYVVGSAGDDEKLKYMLEELKFDKVFNYKKTKPLDALRELCPGGIDVYWDNVGGETLEAALEVSKKYAHFVECGMISGYGGEPYGIKNLFHVIGKRLHMNGFIVYDHLAKYKARMNTEMPAGYKNGSIKYKNHVTNSIENGMEAFTDMLGGKNFGKSILQIASD